MACKRGFNFSTVEKEKLIELVAVYKDIIENKKTDSASVKQKEECWMIICNDFNCDNILNHRSVNSLKTCWDNLKKKTRKHYIGLRRNRFATDGGKSQVAEDPICKRIRSMIDLTVTRLENPFDSEGMVNVGSSCILEGNSNHGNSADEGDYTFEILDEALDTDLTLNIDRTKWNPPMSRHKIRQSMQTYEGKKVEMKREGDKEKSACSPSNFNAKPANAQYKRRRLSESQQKTNTAYRNQQFIELAESKKELVDMLKEKERSKSSLEIEILKVQLEKEQCELEVAKTKLLVYRAIVDNKLPYPANL